MVIPAAATQHKRERVVSLAGTAAIALVALAGALLQSEYPVVDNAMFEYAGRALTHGHVLYRDVWDNKLPAVYYVNALWQLLFGENYAVHAFVEACIAVTSAIVLGLVIRSFDLPVRLPASLVLTVLLCMVFPLNTTEAYALPLILAAILAARRSSALLSGTLIGMATTFWLPSLLMLLPLALLVNRAAWIALVLSPVAVLLCVSAALARSVTPPVLAALVHSWISYVSATPAYTAHYRLPILNRFGAAPDEVLQLWNHAIAAGALPVFAVLLAVLRKPVTRAQRFGVTWVAAMSVAALIGSRFYPHYFIPSLAAALFTITAYGFQSARTWPRVLLVVAALASAAGTARDVRATWSDTRDRSVRTARIGAALHQSAAAKLTLAVDSYQPGLYLAIDPRLRNPYEIAAPAVGRFVQSSTTANMPADIIVYTKPAAGSGARICARTAAPWRIFARSSIAAQFDRCP